MVSQYPYLLLVLKAPNLGSKSPASRDENGDWVAGIPEGANCEYYKVSQCRNGGSNGGSNGDLEYLIDGIKYVYEAIIFAPKSCPKLPLGSKIRVMEANGKMRTEGVVKKFENGQLHSRIWV